MFSYSKVEDSDENSVEEAGLTSQPPNRRGYFTILSQSHLLQAAIACLLCMASFFLGIWSAGKTNEVQCVDTAWDAIRQGISIETQEFNPRFSGPPSAYMGAPNDTIDKLWYDLATLRNFAVPKSVLESINRSRGAVKLPGNDGYQVGLEAFHQLHCLNYIRMYTYMDHYGKMDYDMTAETPEERTAHKDHCIETLRQRLMCTPDMNIYTYHWVNRFTLPWGNLFSSHRCVNWDLFHDWADRNMLSYKAPTQKPEGVEVWN